MTLFPAPPPPVEALSPDLQFKLWERERHRVQRSWLLTLLLCSPAIGFVVFKPVHDVVETVYQGATFLHWLTGLVSLPRSGTGTATIAAGTAGLNGQQITVAQEIIQAGIDRGLDQADIKLALMAAMQESTMQELEHGDDWYFEAMGWGKSDSLGPFQQRERGWGSRECRIDATCSANWFYDALLKVPDRHAMPEWKAIATVQRPAKEYEQHYQQWAETADELLKAVKATPASSAASGKVFPIAGFTVANINSAYGMRDGRMHYGVDLAAALGVPILATQAGMVMVAQMGSNACGGQVEVQHSDGNGERICHASEILVQAGEPISAGQVIAKVGSTGRSTGPHLHFERIERGQSIDPTPYLKLIDSAPLSNGAENSVKPNADPQEKSQWDLSKVQVPFLSFVQQPQTIARNDSDRFTAEIWIQTNAGAAPASGIIVREDGLILTNHHVIANGLLYVKLKDGRQFQGQTIASDHSLDLALVQLDGAANLPVAPLAQSSNVKVGDTVKAIGSPMGSHWKHTEASVIATDSDCGLQALNGRCIRTPSDFLYPGNSGGPLLNDRGEVIGVNRAIQESSGEGVSVPIEVFYQQFKMP